MRADIRVLKSTLKGGVLTLTMALLRPVGDHRRQLQDPAPDKRHSHKQLLRHEHTEQHWRQSQAQHPEYSTLYWQCLFPFVKSHNSAHDKFDCAELH